MSSQFRVRGIMTIAAKQYLSGIEAFRRSHPEMANTNVPLDLTAHWLHALDWPDWAFAGTSLAPAVKLPRRITLADDLTLLANMAQRVGESELLCMLVSWPRFPASPETSYKILSAANLQTVLESLSTTVGRSNPQLEISFAIREDCGCFTVSANPAMGAITGFIEAMIMAHICRMAGLFTGYRRAPSPHPEFVAYFAAQPEWIGTELRGCLPCHVVAGASASTLAIPVELLTLPNPTAQDTLGDGGDNRVMFSNGSPETTSLTNLIHGLITAAMQSDQRVPRANEIAKSLAISERTMARRLASEDASYQGIVSSARRDLAKTLLARKPVSIGQVSRLLGFAEATSFVRAFRTWHGVSPGEWRKDVSA